MKKSLSSILGLGMVLAAMSYEGQGKISGKNPSPKRKPEPHPSPSQKKVEFKEQEGIKKLIKDYQLIKAGESKKGQLKQNRIVGKINWLIEQGILEPKDLTIK